MWSTQIGALVLLGALLSSASTYDFTAIPSGAVGIDGWQLLPSDALITTSGPIASMNETAVYVAVNTSLSSSLPQATLSQLGASTAGLSISLQFRIHSAIVDPVTIASIAGVTLALQPAIFLPGTTLETLFKDDFAEARQGSML